MSYTDINSKVFDKWNKEDWEWGRPISHEEFIKTKKGDYNLKLTPTKYVPHSWIGDVKNKKVLGLASGGAQQMPIMAALGAKVTVLDYSDSQLESEKKMAIKEGYDIKIVKADMSKPLPFKDEEFDLIIHPVSNCYIEEVLPLFKECHRILKKQGRLISGLDIGLNYVFDEEDETSVKFSLPFNPLKDKNLYNLCLLNDWGIQFSHTIEEQIRSQLIAGFTLEDLYEDYNGYGKLNEFKIPTFIATKVIKL